MKPWLIITITLVLLIIGGIIWKMRTAAPAKQPGTAGPNDPSRDPGNKFGRNADGSVDWSHFSDGSLALFGTV